MNLLPTPVSPNPASVSMGQQLFGSLIAGAETGSSGLFSMALSLFGQGVAPSTPINATPLAATPILPSGAPLMADSAQPILLQNLVMAQTTAETPINWQAFFESVSNGTEFSADLKAFLGDKPMSADELQAKLNALDEKTRDALTDELAGLMAAALPLIAPPVALPKETSLDADTHIKAEALISVAPPQGGKEEAALLDSAQQDSLNDSAKLIDAKDDKTSDKSDEKATVQSAMAEQLTRLLQAHQTKETPIPPEVVEKLTAKLQAAPTDSTTDATDIIAAPFVESVSSDKKSKDNKDVSAPSIAAPVLNPQDSTGLKQTAGTGVATENQTQRDMRIETKQTGMPNADIKTTDKTPDKIGAEIIPTASQAMPVAKDVENAPFADQLAKLNRTGAHIPVSDQIAVHLSRAVQSGNDRMTIRLNPAELGRIEVRLDMATDGRVSASFSVDQPATLDLLQRDQKGLERALSDAGLKPDSGSLNFNLRGDGQQHGQQNAQNGQGQNGGQNAPLFSLDGMPLEDVPANELEMSWYVNPDRLDVRI